MCGRYRLSRADRLAAALEAVPRYDEFSNTRIVHRFEFKPGELVPIMRVEQSQRVIDLATWGFVPSWAKGDPGRKPINAKAETIATNGLFRSAFKLSRCLLPADGFYEPKGPKGMKHRPQFFFRRPDDEIFAFAGVCSHMDEGYTCALITTTPNGVVGTIHNRMPVILHPKDYAKWLNPDSTPDELLALLRPAPDSDLLIEPVTIKAYKEPGLFD